MVHPRLESVSSMGLHHGWATEGKEDFKRGNENVN